MKLSQNRIEQCFCVDFSFVRIIECETSSSFTNLNENSLSLLELLESVSVIWVYCILVWDQSDRPAGRGGAGGRVSDPQLFLTIIKSYVTDLRRSYMYSRTRSILHLGALLHLVPKCITGLLHLLVGPTVYYI